MTALRHESCGARVGTASASLDLLRGISALAVVSGHARALFLTPWEKVANKNTPARAAYLLSGAGHQAVMMFFVLSGFLIVSSSGRKAQVHRWRLDEYLWERVCRLATVVWPALLLTALLDRIGSGRPHGSWIYEGSVAYGGVVPRPVADSSGLLDLIGNLAFLQTIRVPTFGSNAPLWSVANEFWYYVLFGLIFAAILSRQNRFLSVVLLVMSFALTLFLPFAVIAYGGAWVVGGMIAVLPIWAPLERFRYLRVLVSLLGLGLFLAAVALADLGSSSRDVLAVSASALLVWSASHNGNESNPPLRSRVGSQSRSAGVLAAHQLATVSFSIYAIHLPLLVFARGLFRPGTFQPTAINLVGVALPSVAACVSSLPLYFLFERHTTYIRRWGTHFLFDDHSAGLA